METQLRAVECGTEIAEAQNQTDDINRRRRVTCRPLAGVPWLGRLILIWARVR